MTVPQSPHHQDQPTLGMLHIMQITQVQAHRGDCRRHDAPPQENIKKVHDICLQAIRTESNLTQTYGRGKSHQVWYVSGIAQCRWAVEMGNANGQWQWAMAVGKSYWAWQALGAWAVGNAKGCSCVGICLVTFTLAPTMTN